LRELLGLRLSLSPMLLQDRLGESVRRVGLRLLDGLLLLLLSRLQSLLLEEIGVLLLLRQGGGLWRRKRLLERVALLEACRCRHPRHPLN
jgi:hypothetical protein